ncbi:uncharacterized protein MKK02DRAFT_28679 [Dioszegia hungarica]|uniref:Uncharacterized protein n=1 Tax=Dioszegia hungarica TaxID=4972 RepID=A0AA38H512_9TREE|nr:uncharacterized protein MKK02DRAFT_28679 [Dioszegia hungarica]KAI9633935.1 hypothetical protein MKK02DRAFT_28679 [Dioszegia hungarica]
MPHRHDHTLHDRSHQNSSNPASARTSRQHTGRSSRSSAKDTSVSVSFNVVPEGGNRCLLEEGALAWHTLDAQLRYEDEQRRRESLQASERRGHRRKNKRHSRHGQARERGSSPDGRNYGSKSGASRGTQAGPHSNTVSTATRTLSAPSTRTEVDPSIATGQQYLTYGYESPQNAQPEPYQMSIAWPGSYGPPQTATEQHEGVPMYDPSQDGGGQSMQLQPYWPAGAIQGVGVPIDDGTEEYWGRKFPGSAPARMIPAVNANVAASLSIRGSDV